MSLKKNIIANYLGQGWTALMSLAFIPLYIQYLGIEAYGLIGIFSLLQTWLSLLDMGMTPTLNREMARFRGGAHDAQSIRNLLRSLEYITFGIAFGISVSVWSLSSWLASNWLSAENLPTSVVAQAFSVMGVVASLRFIEGIYRSSILGLQRHVLFNSVNSMMATLSGLGAVCILAWVSPTIQAFFLWQGIISIIKLLLLALIIYKTLPSTLHKGHFCFDEIHKIWGFASGILCITFLAICLTQIDKVLLSKLLSLKDFGYYTLASMVASLLNILVGPINQAFYPRFCELVSGNNQKHLVRLYHKASQLVTVFIGSAAAILIFFSETILFLWTRDLILAQKIATLLQMLALGNLLNGLLQIPYQMQLAHGWTSLGVKVNIFSVALIIPAVLWTVPRFGAIGAAWVWVALNVGYLFIGIHFMYRHIMRTEKWKWYKQDILMPLLSSFSVASLLSLINISKTTTLNQILVLAFSSSIIYLASALSASELRFPLVAVLYSKFSK